MTEDEAIDAIVACLATARRLNNQTVRKAHEIDAWHQEADELLAHFGFNAEPGERWDAPDRVAHRKRVSEMFR